MRRLNLACALAACLAAGAACTQEAATPSEAAAPSPAPGAAAAPAARDPSSPAGPQSAAPASAPPCRGAQLRLSNEGGDAGAGNRVVDIGVQNVGAQACSLTGYPTVTLQDAQGRDLTAVRSQQATGSYFAPGQPPAPVVLAPGAKAAFELAWNVMPHEDQGERVCPTASGLRVTTPGDSAPATLGLDLTPCGGRVQVSPFRPLAGAAQPAPPPNVQAGASTRSGFGVAERP